MKSTSPIILAAFLCVVLLALPLSAQEHEENDNELLSDVAHTYKMWQANGSNNSWDKFENALCLLAVKAPKTSYRWMAQGKDATGISRYMVGKRVLLSWAVRDPVAAAKWVEQAPAGDIRDRGVFILAAKWMEKDPQAALKWVINNQSQDNGDNLGNLAEIWAAKDSLHAVRWVGQLPAGKARDRATEGVATGWALQDPAEAAKWVESLPKGEAHDKAVAGVARVWMEKDSAEAAKWAESLRKAEVRDRETNKASSKAEIQAGAQASTTP